MKNTYCSIGHKEPKTSTRCGMEKGTVMLYGHNGIPQTHGKEVTTATSQNKNELKNISNAKQKKPDKKV